MTSRLDSYAGKTIVGIDLGTTKSGLAVFRKSSGKVELIKDAEGRSVIPSMVAWNRDEDRFLVGQEAKRYAGDHPEAAARSIKRYIGRWFTDNAVAKTKEERAFKIEGGGGQDQLADIFVNFGADKAGNPVRLSAPEVSAQVLKRLLETFRADPEFQDLPKDQPQPAVITVPAYFNALQRNATQRAGFLAGLDVVDIINEPTASALAYQRFVLQKDKQRRIMVYDLGGGTFDVSILQATLDDDGFAFDTEVVDGNTRLGGDDIDQKVTAWLIREVETQHQCQILDDDYVSRERLRQAGETAKIALSDPSLAEFPVRVAQLQPSSCAPFDVEITLTRAKLEECAGEVIERTRAICNRAVEQLLRKSWPDIDDIVLVGGPTQMPVIQRSIESFSGRKPLALPRGEGVAGPQEAVAVGAGEYAFTLSLGGRHFQERSLQHVVALPVGIHIPKPTPRFQPLIRANSPLPVTEKHLVTTTENNQDHIDVDILQGKQWDATDPNQCDLIGTVQVSNLLPAPAGFYLFEVQITAEDDGTLTAAVTDLSNTIKPEKLSITDRRITTFKGTQEAVKTQ